MTDLITAEEAGKLAHKYRFANNDLERVLCETARTVIALHAQLADAQAAQAMGVERAAEAVKSLCDNDEWNLALHEALSAIRALAPIDGLALVRELRDRAEKAEAELQRFHEERSYVVGANDGWDAAVEQGEASPAVGKAMVRFWKRMANLHLARTEAAEAERDRLAAANAALEAQVGARRAERDQLRAAVEGLIAVLDRNGEKGPIPDVEMMFCWLAAQNVRAAFRNTEGRGDMTDDEALETLFAMANVQDGYAKKATDRGLKIIHKANAKAQREVAATINDLRARLASAEADRDRLAAANAALEARLANGMKWCDLMDGPVSKSQFVNGQATAAQQIRAALAEVQADARREGGE